MLLILLTILVVVSAYVIYKKTNIGTYYNRKLKSNPPLLLHDKLVDDTEPPSFLDEKLVEDSEVVVETQKVEMDNRYGHGPIQTERELSYSTNISFHLERTQEVEGQIGLDAWNTIEAQISYKMSKALGVEIGHQITERVRIAIEVPPGKLSIYQILWKQNIRKGVASVKTGSKIINLPYSIIYGLSSSVKSTHHSIAG